MLLLKRVVALPHDTIEMKNKVLYLIMTLISLMLYSCAAIGGIFKAGVGVGIFMVVIVIVIIVVIISKIGKK